MPIVMPNLELSERRSACVMRVKRSTGPLAEFLESIQAEAQKVILAYGLEPAEAEEILGSALRTLVWKWESVRDRQSWLLAVLARRCQQASALHRMGDGHER